MSIWALVALWFVVSIAVCAVWALAPSVRPFHEDDK